MRITKAQPHVIVQGKPVVVSKTTTQYDQQWWIVTATMLIVDAFMVWLGLTLAYTFRIEWLDYAAPAGFSPNSYSLLTVLSLPLFLLLFRIHGLYDRDNLLGGVTEYRFMARAVFDGIIFIILTSFILRDQFTDISRGWLLAALFITTVLMMVERFVLRQIFNGLRRRGWLMARAIIVGANDQGVAMADLWRKDKAHGMNVLGFLDDFKPIGTEVVGGLKVIGRPTALKRMARETGAHEVIVVPSAVAWETYEEIISTASLPNEYTLRLSTGFYETLANGITITNNTAMPLMTINEARLVGIDAMLKRTFDLTLLALAAVPAIVLSAFVTINLKLMGKKVLAGYQTIGESGKVFTMWKFNTCFASHSGSISSFDRPVETQSVDKITWLDSVLYRSGMDKLPQLWNVLVDEMSVVGPRPRVVGSSAIDSRTMPSLQAVQPGVIGPWSISPAYPAPADELRDELSYVRKWTIWLDAQLAIITVLSIFTISKHARPDLGVTVESEAAPKPSPTTLPPN